MFKRLHGGTFVTEGTYFSLKQGEFVSIPGEGDYLPGTTDTTFIKTPLAMVLLVGPILGLTFVIFLPLAVPLLVGILIVQRLKRRVPELRDSAIQVTTFAQQPGLAYLHLNQPKTDDGKREERTEAPKPDPGGLDEIITQLEEEVARRREQGER